MSLKQRIIQAKAYGQFRSNGELALELSRLARRKIPPQNIHKLIGPKAKATSSSLLPLIAKACGVDLNWLSTGEGEMDPVRAAETSGEYGGMRHRRLAAAAEGLAKALADLDPESPERRIIESELNKHLKKRKK